MTAPTRIRLVLAGNNAIVLACLERLFALEEDLEVIACCGKGQDVLSAARALRPDVLLLDLTLSAGEALALARVMREAELPTRVVFLTDALAQDDLAVAVHLGVAGIAPKDIAPKTLAQCLRRVHAGGVWLPQDASTATGRRKRREKRGELTSREIAVVRLISGGMGNVEIASRLRIGEATVKTYLHRIYEKLRLRDRLQLSIYGQTRGLTPESLQPEPKPPPTKRIKPDPAGSR